MKSLSKTNASNVITEGRGPSCPQGHPCLSQGDLTKHMVKSERPRGPARSVCVCVSRGWVQAGTIASAEERGWPEDTTPQHSLGGPWSMEAECQKRAGA